MLKTAAEKLQSTALGSGVDVPAGEAGLGKETEPVNCLMCLSVWKKYTMIHNSEQLSNFRIRP